MDAGRACADLASRFAPGGGMAVDAFLVSRRQLPFGLRADCGYVLRMDWQQIAALAIVAVTGALFVRARLRRRKAKFPCDSGCGCSGSTPTPGPSVTYHARKGERPEIIVKMR